MKTLYFAHPMSHYNEDIEYECMELIMHSFMPKLTPDDTEGDIYLFNPNDPVLDKLYNNRFENNHEDPFSIFKEIVAACDYAVGVCYTDGAIGCGVAAELQVHIDAGKTVYLIFFDPEFNDRKKFIMPVSSLENFRVLNRDETRQRTEEGYI